ncbi:hypothetical protein [uncultured Kocuria sp.]|uniref:hypothetical protein n=1 Tax=uncultured Kocuria sp. TaxID=259305 RepID=UPI002596D0C7|nr:hypothetical protein [uncultured Kocuria sp.]MCT1368488.1 hypothetical protein [Rothia sp. p3-SID1597]
MKSFARQNVRRAGVTMALAAAVLSATGCGYIHQQPTTIHYAASDGVQANVADAKFRNVMVIAKDKNSPGRLLGTVVNSSDQDLTLTIDTGDAKADVKVPANGEVRFEQKETLLKPVGKAPGELLENTKISSGAQSTTANIPVLDGTLDEYKQYLPNLAETSSSPSAS